MSINSLSDFALHDKNGTELITISEHNIIGLYDANPHTHHNLEISCVNEGSGQYFIDGRQYDLRRGDVIILNNTEPHALFVPVGSKLRHFVIHFDPSFIWNSLSNDLDYNFLLVFFERGENFSNRLDRNNPATERIYHIMQEIYTEFQEHKLCYELIIKIKLQTIFTEIIRNYDYIDRQKVIKPLPESDIIGLNRVMQYIH